MSETSSPNSSLSAAAAYGIEIARERLAGKTVAVITGAGLSTDSGIPDYRGAGRVARHPMQYDVFVGSIDARKRYWARSYVGWSRIAQAEPNQGHFALAEAQRVGRIGTIITQNVDRLHQRAGAQDVIELHGRLDQVRCLNCGLSLARTEVDQILERLNPDVAKDESIEFSPDGDAEIEATADFVVPDCPGCGGMLKPDVVFFGESVPTDRVEACFATVERSDALLVAGSSLAVNSGMRFVKAAHRAGKPIVLVNIGPTKADSLAIAKIEASTSDVLGGLLLG